MTQVENTVLDLRIFYLESAIGQGTIPTRSRLVRLSLGTILTRGRLVRLIEGTYHSYSWQVGALI